MYGDDNQSRFPPSQLGPPIRWHSFLTNNYLSGINLTNKTIFTCPSSPFKLNDAGVFGINYSINYYLDTKKWSDLSSPADTMMLVDGGNAGAGWGGLAARYDVLGFSSVGRDAGFFHARLANILWADGHASKYPRWSSGSVNNPDGGALPPDDPVYYRLWGLQ
jgi:prepilin-type processing-associated H-X9-DG protein